MRIAPLLLSLPLVLSAGPSRVSTGLPIAVPNPNREGAGRFQDGILSVALEAKLTMWHPDGDSLPGIVIEAFAEPGRSPQAPGPFIRVALGTRIHASVLNSLERDTLTFYFHFGEVSDSVMIPPGSMRELRARPARPGTFLYRATTSTPLGRSLRFGGLLSGGVVIDSAAVVGAPRDRVFVMQVAADSTIPNSGIPLPDRSVWAINGRSWPHTERFSATAGDTMRWRFINATNDQHPMHLHGFYYTVDAFDGPPAATQSQGPPGRRVVTERMAQFTTMSTTWIPERAGNWLFHCHFQEHVVPHGSLGGMAPAGDTQRIAPPPTMRHREPHKNHALTGMGGLVLGIEVRPRRGERIARPRRGRRHLRLVAIEDSLFPDSLPSLRFVLEDPRSASPRIETGPGLSPAMHLTRGEPVSITIVNRMREATAVHWHGIELESYFDGVPGFAGYGRQVAPIIAPLDSFEARFTPPRAGTFIYHSHVDEPRQHRAGLVGPLIVHDAAPRDSSEELIVLIKSPRAGRGAGVAFEINGKTNPDTFVLAVGRKYRLRFVAIQRALPVATVSITARPDSSFLNVPDTLVATWRPLAKDGADLPESTRALTLARRTMGMGETYDYEFIPDRRGLLRIEIRTASRLAARVPIRVD